MEKKIVVTAKTVEEAKAKAAEELGVVESAVSFTVLAQPKKTLFGGLKGEAKVEATIDVVEPEPVAEETKPEEAAAPAAPAAAPEAVGESARVEISADELPEENAKKLALAQEYLTSVLDAMGLTEIEKTVHVYEDSAVIDLSGEKVGVIIGRRGETLDALQYLTSLVANRGGGNYFRISLDSGNYREKRKEALRGLARRVSRSVLKTGRSSTLEPMNPYERRIIHAAVSEIDGVESKSIGDEPNRRVVVSSLNPRYGSNRGNRSRSSNRGGYRPRYDKKSGDTQKGDFVSIRKSSFEEEYKNRSVDRKSIYLDADEADAAYEEMDKQGQEALKEKAAEVQLYGKIEL